MDYIYVALDCIVAALGVHTERLHRQRVIKQRQKHQPIVEMRKEEVEQQRLEEYVLRDDDDVQTFSVWWELQRMKLLRFSSHMRDMD